MRCLLDTHVWIWMVTEPEKLSPAAKAVIDHPDTTLFLSAASTWEMSIKVGLGRLDFDDPLPVVVDRSMRRARLEELAVSRIHTYGVAGLPSLHADPFDRLLIAQAIAEGMVLLTADQLVRRYPVETLWD